MLNEFDIERKITRQNNTLKIAAAVLISPIPNMVGTPDGFTHETFFDDVMAYVLHLTLFYSLLAFICTLLFCALVSQAVVESNNKLDLNPITDRWIFKVRDSFFLSGVVSYLIAFPAFISSRIQDPDGVKPFSTLLIMYLLTLICFSIVLYTYKRLRYRLSNSN